jgi:Icc-related predicted phosphoesterase
VRVVATSDLHGHLPDVPDCDVLLIGGDICPDLPVGKAERYSFGMVEHCDFQARWLDNEFRAWLGLIVDRGIQVIAIWGNHDFIGEHPGMVPELPWTLLQDELFETAGGLTVYGTPWVPGLERWAFYGSPEALVARAEAIPEGIDVLLSHGPPYGTADFVAPQYGSCHVGDRALASELTRIRPKVMVVGHIHERKGVCRAGNIPVYNVSHVSTYPYRPTYPPQVIWDVSD